MSGLGGGDGAGMADGAQVGTGLPAQPHTRVSAGQEAGARLVTAGPVARLVAESGALVVGTGPGAGTPAGDARLPALSRAQRVRAAPHTAPPTGRARLPTPALTGVATQQLAGAARLCAGLVEPPPATVPAAARAAVAGRVLVAGQSGGVSAPQRHLHLPSTLHLLVRNVTRQRHLVAGRRLPAHLHPTSDLCRCDVTESL